MKCMNHWVAAALIVALAPLTGCQKQDSKHEAIHPAKAEDIEGSKLKRLTLTERAMERLDLQLAEVSMRKGPRQESLQLSVPYGALIYDAHGTEWVYTSPEDRVFIRAKVKVDYIEGVESPEENSDGRKMMVFLKDGPEIGTRVVSVATEELYGEEKGIGH